MKQISTLLIYLITLTFLVSCSNNELNKDKALMLVNDCISKKDIKSTVTLYVGKISLNNSSKLHKKKLQNLKKLEKEGFLTMSYQESKSSLYSVYNLELSEKAKPYIKKKHGARNGKSKVVFYANSFKAKDLVFEYTSDEKIKAKGKALIIPVNETPFYILLNKPLDSKYKNVTLTLENGKWYNCK